MPQDAERKSIFKSYSKIVVTNNTKSIIFFKHDLFLYIYLKILIVFTVQYWLYH